MEKLGISGSASEITPTGNSTIDIQKSNLKKNPSE